MMATRAWREQPLVHSTGIDNLVIPNRKIITESGITWTLASGGLPQHASQATAPASTPQLQHVITNRISFKLGGDSFGCWVGVERVRHEEPEEPDTPVPLHPASPSFHEGMSRNFIDNEVSPETLRYIIDNVFLPAKLPDEEDPDATTKDSSLLSEVARVAALFKDDLRQNPNISRETSDAWDVVSRMFDAMLAIRTTNRLDKSSIEVQLQSMEVRDVFPIYVQHQNAGIIFRKRSADELSFESFEISIPNEEVVTTIGKLLVQYPANDRLLIPAVPELFSPLANTIAFLGSQTMSDATPILVKAGVKHENIRDTPSPRWITEALAGYLRAIGRVEVRPEGTHAIRKRIDDHVLLGPGKTLPWRRSAMWLLIRVALQSTLEELGVAGGEGYKAFQAYFMARLLERCVDDAVAIVPDDVIDAMNRKVARRMRKMKEWVDVEDNPFPTLRFVEKVITNVSEVLADHWKEDRDECVKSVPWIPPTQQEIEESLELSLKTNQKYLQSVVGRTEELANSVNDYDDVKTTRNLIAACSRRLDMDCEELPATINKAEMDLGLMDFETWVERRLPAWSDNACRSEADCEALSSIMGVYSKYGLKHYSESPERMSIFWLTLMELWIALDILVVKWSPLMKRFSPEISARLLVPLLLPTRSHLMRLDAVQSYIARRHNESTGKTLFNDIESPQSFQNLYFEQSSEMQKEKVVIEKWTLEEKQRTLQKMREANAQYHDWEAEHRRISCTRYGKYEENHYPSACRRCTLDRLMKDARTPKFEEPLPTSKHSANPIVFELNCPTTFGLWREATYQLLFHAFSHSEESGDDLYKLESYVPTNRFYHAQERSISIAFSTAPIANSVLKSQHTLPANSNDVLVSHSGQYFPSYGGSQLVNRAGSLLRGLCTLHLDGPYTSLSNFIDDTTHSPNAVIASQSDCPTAISLGEYIAFGHLRSGNEIQLRNIMRVLISDSLSLNEAGVHSLIMQAIWQAGPNVQTEAWYRDAHEDLLDTKFAMEMLSVLNDNMAKLGGSGREVFHLATLITLATRLLSLSQDDKVKDGCFSFLAAARRTASAWMTLVKDEARVDTIGDPAKWQHRMALVAVVWRLAFEVDDDELLEHICKSPDNLADLLFTKMTIAADSTQYKSLSNATKLLLRREQGLSYHLEPYIASALKASWRPLDEATCVVLENHQYGTHWNPLASDGSRWWKRVTKDSVGGISGSICINILSGDLLVDGKPVNRLPDSYITHRTYQKLFGESVSLWCHPSRTPGMEYEASYRGNQLCFAMIGTALIIRVLRKGTFEEYIPRDQIQGDVPSVLLQCHHWYCEALQVIQFRPLESPWDSDGLNWILDLKENHPSALRGNLQKSASRGLERAMDPHSLAFSRLHDAIKALEPNAFDMTAVVSPSILQTSLVEVTLPGHNMEFFLNCGNRLECRSHPGYLLDFDRDIGCLYGLVDYLVLCDGSPSEQVRKVIVPRGRLEAVESLRHPIVRVCVDGTTGCHIYDVDELVGRLCGSGTMESNLFLVELHAFTASHQPDPLTMRTGTDEALQCLEGASLLSHHEASNSWRKQMERIATMSPRREYYPRGMKLMERTEWNNSLPTASQHPGFEQRIIRILSYWSKTYLEKLLLEHTEPLESSSGMADLSRRAAIRDLRPTSYMSAPSEHRQDDNRHLNRDALHHHESQIREGLAYQVTNCVARLTSGLPICSDLGSLAKKWHRVKKTQTWGWLDLSQWLCGNLSESDVWCTLYELCRNASLEEPSSRFDPAMTLAMLACKESVPLATLGTLVAIICDQQFRETELHYPVRRILEMNTGSQFDRTKIRHLVKSTEIGFDNSPEYNLDGDPGMSHEERRGLRETDYNRHVENEVERTLRKLEGWWCDIPNRHSTIVLSPTPRLRNLDSCIDITVRPLLDHWIRNGTFLDHLKAVSNRISQFDHSTDQPALHRPQIQSVGITRSSIDDITLEILMNERDVKLKDICGPVVTLPDFAEQQPASAHGSRISNLRTFVGGLDIVLRGQIERRYVEDFSRSVTALAAASSAPEAQIPSLETLLEFRDSQEKYHTLMHKKIVRFLLPVSRSEKLLGVCGLWPRVTTSNLLQRLSLKQRNRTPPSWIAAISQFANQIIAVQQSKRLLRYGTLGMNLEYDREILQSRKRDSLGDPDWLLVEIDADLCIRSDQVEIATSMLAPIGGKNTVSQLNMGEGKSSVIVPVVSMTAANAQRLVRVVVLKPQSKLQLNLLRARLSRLANRRVICLPFSRDLQVDRNSPSKIRKILQDCHNDGAIWLCQPEHILSFKLLGLDLFMRASNDRDIGEGLIKCQLWMQEHTRDILDESDEILHTRHQLVYTVGDQRSFDAGSTRWEVVEEILTLLQSQLRETHSSHFLVGPLTHPGQFPTIRMMSDNGNALFHQLAEDIIFGDTLPSLRTASLPAQLKVAALRLLKDHQVTDADTGILSLQRYCKEKHEDVLWKSLLLVRGLIAFKILPLVLQNKRCRVDYGLAPLQGNECGPGYSRDIRRTHLAVPYRAKDSPSLRSNFAHPDVLILLTCLTYYYDGLNDSMIIQTFKELLKSDSPELIYERWTEDLPIQFRRLSSVNMDNEEAILRSLHPSMGRNKRVTDFFLNQCVFPKEAKEFPFKMSTSGWDLAMKKNNPTTGFSGTNDSRFLLPTTIIQGDLPPYQHTNALVVAHLLQDKNSDVISHENNITSSDILDLILGLPVEDRATVLLDVGAQILDCSNEEFVDSWLSKVDDSMKAAVFFDNDDNLLIRERDGTVRAFADSPYSSRLSECVVYLDDPHTRGTDLKLPIGCRAAVTLGPRLAKDKLVQGCMRMRKLGSGLQSLVFLAPEEVISDVKNIIGDPNTTVKASHVVLWAMNNTCRQLQENVANWAIQGYEFADREDAWKEISEVLNSGKEINSAEEIKRLFCQEEGRSLSQLYGIHRVDEEHEGNRGSGLRMEIQQHCELFDAFSLNDARVQEEQEVELVHELQVEREVERPPAAEAAPHALHQDVRDFARTGLLPQNSSAFLRVEDSIAETSLLFPDGGSSVFRNLIVTKDYHRTIKRPPADSTGGIDEFLRPLEWAVTSQLQPRSLVALSPFEVNALLPAFRKSPKVRLRFFAARTSLTMQSLEDLTLFTLPTSLPTRPILASLSQQLNLYSGALYLRDPQSYENVCASLRLHFGQVPQEILDMAIELSDGFVKNSNGFVKDVDIRAGLDLIDEHGFEEDPVKFFRELFHLRRHGRGFRPSHMGQVLFGRGLDHSTLWG